MPPALDFSLRPGEYRVSVLAAGTAVLVGLVVAAIIFLAVRTQPRGTGSVSLFLAVWFSTVIASMVGATVQVAGSFLGDLSTTALPATVNGLIPYLTGGGYRGVALGWLVALTAVFVRSRVSVGRRGARTEPVALRGHTGRQ